MSRKSRSSEARRGEPAPGHRPEADAGGDPGPAPPPDPWSRAWLAEWARTLLYAALIFVVLRTFVVESFVISSGSMEDTLLVGDFLLVNKLGFGPRIPFTNASLPGWDEPRRGDIVVFRSDHAPGLDLVKRLVGVPGDTLAMRDGVLYVNGERREEPYVEHDPAVADVRHPSMGWQAEYLASHVEREEYRPTRDDWGPIVIPPLRFFMLGDNREHSLDSRFWGLVERRKMKGQPFFIYYSYDRDALEPFRPVTAMRPGRIGLPPE